MICRPSPVTSPRTHPCSLRLFQSHQLHGPAVGRGANRSIAARVSGDLVLDQIAVEGRAGSEARTHRAGPVTNAVAVDHVTGHGRRDVAARDSASVARGARLSIDGIGL